jgi:AcrR family transcriptional regulator
MVEALSPRERRYQRTQQAILAAAHSLLTEGGPDALSIRAIADRIDYSPAGLYEYYGSKEEIIAALCWEGHQQLKRAMEQVPLALPPDEYMVEIGMAYIHFALQNPEYFLLIFSTSQGAAFAQPPAQMLEGDSSFPLLLKGVQRAMESGVIKYLPGLGLFETAYTFWAIVHGAAMLRITILTNVHVDFDSADRAMITAHIRGMKQWE